MQFKADIFGIFCGLLNSGRGEESRFPIGPARGEKFFLCGKGAPADDRWDFSAAFQTAAAIGPASSDPFANFASDSNCTADRTRRGRSIARTRAEILNRHNSHRSNPRSNSRNTPADKTNSPKRNEIDDNRRRVDYGPPIISWREDHWCKKATAILRSVIPITWEEHVSARRPYKMRGDPNPIGPHHGPKSRLPNVSITIDPSARYPKGSSQRGRKYLDQLPMIAAARASSSLPPSLPKSKSQGVH